MKKSLLPWLYCAVIECSIIVFPESNTLQYKGVQLSFHCCYVMFFQNGWHVFFPRFGLSGDRKSSFLCVVWWRISCISGVGGCSLCIWHLIWLSRDYDCDFSWSLRSSAMYEYYNNNKLFSSSLQTQFIPCSIPFPQSLFLKSWIVLVLLLGLPSD